MTKILTLLTALLLLSGCAATKMLPMTIQSDPLGAHVLYQVQSKVKGSAGATDWIYLGLTPLDVRREVGKSQLKKADAFILKVVKDGFLDQQKAFTGGELLEQVDTRGRVFWNPRLVSAN